MQHNGIAIIIWLIISGGVIIAAKIKQKIVFMTIYFIKKKTELFFFNIVIYKVKGIIKHKIKAKNK